MAAPVKQYYHDIDLVKVGQLTNARIQNVADSTALGGITSPGIGQIAYQVDTDELKIYDGSAWDSISPNITGDVIFKGTLDASTSLDSGQPQTVEKVSGYQYVVTTEGSLSMTGVAFTPSAAAEVGDVVLFTSATTASVFQRNTSLASNAEAAAGTEAANVITPATLSHAMRTNRYTRQYTATVNLVAETELTVEHSLALVNRDAFTVNVMYNNSAISVDVDSTDANNLKLTSSVSLTGVVVTVVGASSSEFAIA